MQQITNWLANSFSLSILLGGIFADVDWAKLVGVVGVVAAAANHLHQIYVRVKRNNKNKKSS